MTSRLRAILAELVGLFIDDGSLAIALVAWTVVAGAVTRYAGLTGGAAGLAFFAGCVVILLENVLRRARRR